MQQKTWMVELDGRPHTVELLHTLPGFGGGNKIIKLDGQMVEKIRSNQEDWGSLHRFSIGERPCILLIRVENVTGLRYRTIQYSYDLFVDGQSVTTGAHLDWNKESQRINKLQGFALYEVKALVIILLIMGLVLGIGVFVTFSMFRVIIPILLFGALFGGYQHLTGRLRAILKQDEHDTT